MAKPQVSVVIPTRNRPAGLNALMATLRQQTLAAEAFEVIVVDDGSDLPQHIEADGLPWRLIRHKQPGGPAAARNTGWRAARAPLVAFIDDDCTAVPGWLTAVVEAGGADDAIVVQGPVEPPPHQLAQRTPLSHTIEIAGPTPLFVSCNIAYSRSLLEAVGGFDETFKRACGEDVELGARAVKAGARTRFAPDAMVHHELRQLGLKAQLRHTFKWTDSVRAVSMHRELRDLLTARVFWKPTHPQLLLAAAGLSTRRPLVAIVAALPYLDHYRRQYNSQLPALAEALPVHLAVDACEVATMVAGSVRHRTLML